MKVLIIRDTVAGKKPVFVGDVVDLPEQEARELILMKKAAPSDPSPSPSPKPSVLERGEDVIETAELKVPEIETSVKRGKRKE